MQDTRPLSKPIRLAHEDWRYVDKRKMDDYDPADWVVWGRQRNQFFAEQSVSQILRMLAVQKDDPSYLNTINNYYHCLQTATRMLRDNLSEEDVTVGLLHDVGFIACNETHGEFAAALLRPYVSERNLWMLTRHAIFQQWHCRDLPGCDRDARERWRGHPHFEWTAEFVDKYDQGTINYDEEILPLEAFEPIVRRVFARPPAGVHYE